MADFKGLPQTADHVEGHALERGEGGREREGRGTGRGGGGRGRGRGRGGGGGEGEGKERGEEKGGRERGVTFHPVLDKIPLLLYHSWRILYITCLYKL